MNRQNALGQPRKPAVPPCGDLRKNTRATPAPPGVPEIVPLPAPPRLGFLSLPHPERISLIFFHNSLPSNLSHSVLGTKLISFSPFVTATLNHLISRHTCRCLQRPEEWDRTLNNTSPRLERGHFLMSVSMTLGLSTQACPSEHSEPDVADNPAIPRHRTNRHVV